VVRIAVNEWNDCEHPKLEPSTDPSDIEFRQESMREIVEI